MNRSFRNSAAFTLSGLALAALVGCGGDDTVFLNLKGVAATGSAISGGSVDVRCASGTGTATTAANGSYTVSVADGQGPCLVTVTKDNLVLRSIAPKTTTGQSVANVTPISDAIVTAVAASKGAATPLELVTKASSIPTATDLTEVVKVVLTQINQALVALGKSPLPEGTDLLGKADFVAATPTAPSNDALDQALDALVVADPVSGVLALPTTIVEQIKEVTKTVVKPNATGAV